MGKPSAPFLWRCPFSGNNIKNKKKYPSMNQLITLIIEGYLMKLLGSSIYVTSTFYDFEGVVWLVHWTHSFFVFL